MDTSSTQPLPMGRHSVVMLVRTAMRNLWGLGTALGGVTQLQGCHQAAAFTEAASTAAFWSNGAVWRAWLGAGWRC